MWTLWSCTLHSHRETELSAISLLRNGNAVGAAMRARMSHLSSKTAQPLSSTAQLLGTLCVLFRLSCRIHSSVPWLIPLCS